MRTLHISALAILAGLHCVASAPFDDSQQIVFKDHPTTASSIVKSLKKAEVIPDVLDNFTPLFSLNITYPKTGATLKLGNKIKPSAVSSSPDVYVDDLEDSVEGSDPIFHIQAIANDDDTIPTPTLNPNTTFTLVLTDPDATSRANPTKAEMCHWIVTDFSMNSTSTLPSSHQLLNLHSTALDLQSSFFENLDIMAADNKPTELMSYYPPAPPPKTGYHRYVFVLLAPEAEVGNMGGKDGGLKKPKERPHWGYGKVGKGVRDWAKDNGLKPVGANFFYARNKKQ